MSSRLLLAVLGLLSSASWAAVGLAPFPAADTPLPPASPLPVAPGLNADYLDGRDALDFAAAQHDHDARYYTEQESDARFLAAGGKAADADALDGLDASQFLRSDAGGVLRGDLTVEGRVQAREGVGVLARVDRDGAASTESVDAGRYRAGLTRGPMDKLMPLDMGVMRALCGDRDGCWVTLALEDMTFTDARGVVQTGVLLAAAPIRFFLPPGNVDRYSVAGAWFGIDGDRSGAHIIAKSPCAFTDQDVLYDDTRPGLSLQATALGNANVDFYQVPLTCTLLVEG